MVLIKTKSNSHLISDMREELQFFYKNNSYLQENYFKSEKRFLNFS